MNECLNCKKEISGKAKYCSDKCRMAYQRRTKQGEQPEQKDPDFQPEQTRTGLTRTDSLFERSKPGYYKFNETAHEEKCLQCGKNFKTSLDLLRHCSPQHMLDTLNDLVGHGDKKL